MSDTKNLATAICAVMSEVASLPKDGHNDFSNYDFTTEAMIVNTFRPLMVKHGLAFVPHNVSVTSELPISEKMRRVAISATYLLMHTSGENLTITVPGEGMDSLDKSTAKALTQALKYALLQVFLAGRGEDGDTGKGYEKPKESENAAVRKAADSQAAPPDPDVYVLDFGKHEGEPITAVDTGYLEWLLRTAREELNDPEKARFKMKNLKRIDLVLRELKRREDNARVVSRVVGGIPEDDTPF